MKRLPIMISALGILLLISGVTYGDAPAAAKGKIESSLTRQFASNREEATYKVWVYFVDKGFDSLEKAGRLDQAEAELTDKARARGKHFRRQKIRRGW